MWRSKTGGVIGVIVLMVIILGIRYPQLVSAPNDWVIGDSYDGFRSYAALHYHVKHDSTYGHYEGMHYPYGDGVTFTDNLPLLANSIKWVSQNIVDVSAYTGGILNIFLLLSIIACTVLLYLIFRHLKLPDWYSIPIAIGLTMLSPQLGRFAAHYGLAHPFTVPLLVYLSLLSHERPRWGLSIGMGLVLVLLSQLHFYLFAIGGIFLGLLWGFKILHYLRTKEVWSLLGHGFVQVILPMGLLLLWVKMNDPVTDRPAFPYGFFAYRAYPESIFLPSDFQLGRWINEYIYTIRPLPSEGKAYIGLIAVFFVFKESLLLFFARIRRRVYHSLPEGNRIFWRCALWSSIILLLFSMCFPFFLAPFRALPEKLGILAQFRSVGRFAWVFFYVINIIAFYSLFFQVKKIKKTTWQRLGYAALFGILCLEGWTFLFSKKKVSFIPHPEQREHFQRADNPWLDSLDFSEFQSILPIIFMHMGSENYGRDPMDKDMHRVLWATVQTGLPTHTSFMGRTSVGQTMNQIELISEPYRVPKILEDLPNQKDFLVFVYKKTYRLNWYYYTHLIGDLRPIYEDDEILLFRLPVSHFYQNIENSRKSVFKSYARDTLYPIGEVLSKDSLPTFIYNSYDDQKSDQAYRGGAYQNAGQAENILYDGSIPQQDSSQRYVFSVWAYVAGDLNAKLDLWIEEYDPSTNKILKSRHYQANKLIRSFEEDWALIDVPFYLESEESHLRFTMKNLSIREKPLFLDELQIRAQSTRIYRETETEVMRNNRWFGKE